MVLNYILVRCPWSLNWDKRKAFKFLAIWREFTRFIKTLHILMNVNEFSVRKDVLLYISLHLKLKLWMCKAYSISLKLFLYPMWGIWSWTDMHYKMSVFLKGWVSSPVFSIAWKVKRQSYNNLSNRIVLLVVSALLHLKLLMCVCGRGWPGLKWLEANINCSNPYFASFSGHGNLRSVLIFVSLGKCNSGGQWGDFNATT